MVVRTFTGAWIETCIALPIMRNSSFAPSRVRGLKQVRVYFGSYYDRVRTFTGAWIETRQLLRTVPLVYVRTFTGAWIETSIRWIGIMPVPVRTFTGAWIETII